MKKKRPSQSGSFNPRVLLGFVLGSLGVLLALVGFGISSGTTALAQDPNQPSIIGSLPAAMKIAPEVLADTADGKIASVVILLSDQADVSAAHEMKDQDARGWFVYNTLTQHAARTQAPLHTFLTAQGVGFQSFWAANMIVATADRSLVESLALRPDVARIDSNRPARWIEDPEIANLEVTPESPNDPNVAEWGVQNVNAPAVWAMGFTGQGMVIGNQDTGTRWSHNALKPKYRGWNGTTADHNFNWHDAIHSGGGDCGANTMAPCDDQGHGTHTAGTTVGDDGAGNQVGVAPGAKWIACRNMNVGNGTPATYTECFQFMIAPTDLAGNNANPALRPHVLNNSWGCPASEGCVTRAELETIVNNTQAAGIFVEVSAGNSGSGCSSVSDAPAIYSASFSTGAISISNTLASFSSRGPSTFYNPSLLKPNISAPGVNVRSSTRTSDTSFGGSSGTSMAGPHVAGVVALLWSARPALVRDIAATKSLLENTANPAVTVTTPQTCGGTPSTQIPNNSFGYGRVDALAAVNGAATATPTPTPTPATPTPTPPTPTPTPPPPTPTPTPPPPTPTPPPPTPTPTSTPPNPTPTPTATATVFPSPITFPDLVVTKTDSIDPVQVGNNLTYTITVSNVDPSLSMTATMTDILPAGVNFVSVTPSQGSCTGTSTIVCNLGGIAAGASATVSLVVTPTVAGTLSNTASVPDFEDPTPGNNRDTELTTVLPASTPPPASPTPTDHPGPSPTPSATATASPTATVAPSPTPSPPAQAINLSTRMFVQTGDNVGIGGFIITGSVPKHVVVRAFGPSSVPGALADPVLELHGPPGFTTIINDNCADGQIPPPPPFCQPGGLDAGIEATLDPGAYTAIVRGNNNTTGIALVEVYDLDQSAGSRLANISTRAFVNTSDNIVIAGFILGGNSGPDRIVLRGIGPSLTDFGVINALVNPTLELRDENGALLIANNDWQDDPAQAAELIAAGLAPTNDLESGIATVLPPGPYTALLAGANNGTGVGLVEVYDRGAP